MEQENEILTCLKGLETTAKICKEKFEDIIKKSKPLNDLDTINKELEKKFIERKLERMEHQLFDWEIITDKLIKMSEEKYEDLPYLQLIKALKEILSYKYKNSKSQEIRQDKRFEWGNLISLLEDSPENFIRLADELRLSKN